MKKILVSLPEGTYKIIEELKGEFGASNSAVIRNIVIAYLSEQGYYSNIGSLRARPTS